MQRKRIQPVSMRLQVRSLASLNGLSGGGVSCGVGCRLDLDPELLWLWHRPAAVTPIQPLAWEPPCAVGVALKSKKEGRKEEKIKKKELNKQKISSSSIFIG